MQSLPAEGAAAPAMPRNREADQGQCGTRMEPHVVANGTRTESDVRQRLALLILWLI